LIITSVIIFIIILNVIMMFRYASHCLGILDGSLTASTEEGNIACHVISSPSCSLAAPKGSQFEKVLMGRYYAAPRQISSTTPPPKRSNVLLGTPFE
jgi:hypothetical protein